MNVFEKFALEYDEWFETHTWVYQSEVEAVRKFIPETGKGIEIGVGTGRFSIPFGIKVGVEPAQAMAGIARKRGIHVHEAKAETLPSQNNSFDFALMVTTLCFVENPLQALGEIKRILKPDGKIIIGMLDEESPLVRLYKEKRNESKFYRDAKYYSVNQVLDWLKKLEFDNLQTVQTIFKTTDKIQRLEPVEEGSGKGLFVVISAKKKNHEFCRVD
ncbi:MAG TPA: class I SAM-dependent methyltransferase [Candidatus Brocadiaceae bacterium]